MSGLSRRYSQLAPLNVEDQVRLTKSAVYFFSPLNYSHICARMGLEAEQGKTTPLGLWHFLQYLSKTGELEDAPRYMYVIDALLSRLARAGILMEARATGAPPLGRHFYFMRELTTLEKTGFLWFAPALGPAFLYEAYGSVTVQLTGVAEGEPRAGTGLVIGPNVVVTCAHVIRDMDLDYDQMICGTGNRVVGTKIHDVLDVGLVEFAEELPCGLPGLAFRDPMICEHLFTLGYPRIPFTYSDETPLVMQAGEVTVSDVTTFGQQRVFLFSAITRPGSSGGPILSATGHVLGISTEELRGERGTKERPILELPFHAGVRSSDVMSAVSELDPSIRLPFERYQ